MYDPRVMRADEETSSSDLLKARLRAGILVWMGGAVVFLLSPLWLGPLRDPWLWAVQLGHLGSLFAYLALRRVCTRAAAERLARAVVVWVAIQLAVVAALTAEPAAAMIMSCTLALVTATLLPWRVTSQVFTMGVIALSMMVAVTWRRESPAAIFSESMLGLYASLGASLFIARVLRVHRREAERVACALREEARISQDMARFGGELIAALEQPALLARLGELTAAVFACDVSYTLLYGKDDKLVLREGYGYEAAEWRAVERYTQDLPPGAAAVFLSHLEERGVAHRIFSSGTPLPLAPETRRRPVTMVIYLALRKAGRVVGFQAAGFRGRAEPPTVHEERLAHGVAHLASLVLQTSRLLTELEAANRFQTDFLANMSHELRTPLNVILGYNEMLIDGALGPLNDEQIATLTRVSRTAEGQLALVTATLELSSLEADRVPRDVSAVDLQELIADLADEVAVTSSDAGLSFDWEVDEDLPLIGTDVVKLKMMLKNLVENAIKYTERGGVRVRARRTAREWLEIEVEDTGAGIPAEALEVIFEAFRQHNSERGGVGLGLHIVQRLSQVLGGDVRVDSEVGRGSTFTVRIPCEVFPQRELVRASA